MRGAGTKAIRMPPPLAADGAPILEGGITKGEDPRILITDGTYRWSCTKSSGPLLVAVTFEKCHSRGTCALGIVHRVICLGDERVCVDGVS